MGPSIITALLIRLLIGALIGAFILRAACALFNKWFVSDDAPPPQQTTISFGGPPVSDGNPYHAPSTASFTESYEGPVEIPMFSKAFGIMLAALAVAMVCAFGIAVALGSAGLAYEEILIITGIFQVLIQYLALSLFTKIILPTTFKRGLAISLLFLLVAFLVGVAIGIVVAIMVGIFSVTGVM